MRELTVTRNTAGPVLPALIAGAGERATPRFLVRSPPRSPARVALDQACLRG